MGEVMRANWSDLEEGKIFCDYEVIINVDDNSMRTIQRHEVELSGEFYDVAVFSYDIRRNDGSAQVHHNGTEEISTMDERYEGFVNRLVLAGVW